jgi:AraC-like DNA-binding protein
MSTPLSFLKNDVADTIQTLSEVAPFARGQLLRNASGKMYQAGRSHMLQQYYAGPGCWVIRYDFFHPQPAKWHLQPSLNHTALLYVFRRGMILEFDGGRAIELQEGFCYLLNLQAMQQIVTTFPDGHTEVLWIAIDEHFMQRLEFVDQQFSKLRIDELQGQRITLEVVSQLQQIADYTGEPRYFSTYVNTRVTDIVLDYVARYRNEHFHPKYLKIIEIKKVIDNNLGERISLTDLSRRAAMNMTELQKRFRKAFGLSIDRYQMKMRMERAADLLVRERELSVSDIAWKVGYREESSFIRIFRRTYGITPLQYRKRYEK